MSKRPAPPVPAPRTKGPPRERPSTSDNLSNQSQATTSHHPTTSVTSSTCANRKAKFAHPWMTIVHPGPWTQLPPAQSPFTPPWASSLPAQRKGWFKARVPPSNPFSEANKVANYITGRKTSKQPANQTKRSEPTSQSRKDPSPPKEKSDIGGQPSSRENSNAASVSGTSSKASPFDEPAPSEKPPCEDPPPSAQTDGSAASSPGLSESTQDSPGESPAAACLPEGLGDTPKLAQLVGLASSVNLASFRGLGNLADKGSGLGGPGLLDVSNALGDLAIVGEDDIAGGLGVPMGLAGLASGLGVPDIAGQATSRELSNIPGLGSLSGDDLVSRLAEGGNPPGSLEVIGVPELAELGSLSSLATSVVPPDLASFVGPGSLAHIGSDPGVPGVQAKGECPAMGGLMESACPGALAAALGLPSIPKSFSVPAIFSVQKKGSTTPSQSETCRADQKSNPKPAVPRSNTMQASLSSRPQAPGHGFPPIKRKVRTDACVPTDDLQGELGEVSKRLEELELCGVPLESNLRGCKNKKEEEALLTDWMALIQEKQTLLRREAEITLLTTQKMLEERQADLEYKLRCLLIKPESEWSAEDEAQEQKMLEDLVAVIEQRNQIISSLDEDRQRDKEDDSVLGAMQDKELQKRGLNELKKSKGKFKPMKVFRMLSTQASQDSRDKKN